MWQSGNDEEEWFVSDGVHDTNKVGRCAGANGAVNSCPTRRKPRIRAMEATLSGVVPGLLTESTRVGQKHLSGLSWHDVELVCGG